jgi:uncharacterized transporter YbjL
MLFLCLIATLFTVIGCGSSTKIDPGTAAGTYSISVTGTAGTGSAQIQASVNVPVTVH